MIEDGEMSAETGPAGEYRWSYVTPGGAMYLGPKFYKTKAQAIAAGKRWLEEMKKRR